MFRLLHHAYAAIFRRYPVLARMALVAALGEIVFASTNNYALGFYVKDELGRPAAVVGLLVSTFLLAELLLKLPFGHLSDRHGRRGFVMGGLAVCVVGPLTIFLVPTEWLAAGPMVIYLVLVPLRALDGVGAAALWPPLFAAVSDHVPARDRAAAMSVMNTAYLAGLVLGPTLAGLAMKAAQRLGSADPWAGKAPFGMAAVAAAAGAVLAAGLPQTHGRPEWKGAPRPAAKGSLPFLVAVAVVTAGEMFATCCVAPYLALYVREVTGIHRSSVGFLLLILFVPAGLLGIPVGRLSDRLPRRAVVQAGLFVAAAGLWLVPSCRSLVALLLAGVMVVVGFLLGLPAWLALISDLSPGGARGRTMGMMATAQGIGAFLGPLAGGRLWEVDIQYPWYAAAGVLTLAACAALVLPLGGAGAASAGGELHLSEVKTE